MHICSGGLIVLVECYSGRSSTLKRCHPERSRRISPICVTFSASVRSALRPVAIPARDDRAGAVRVRSKMEVSLRASLLNSALDVRRSAFDVCSRNANEANSHHRCQPRNRTRHY